LATPESSTLGTMKFAVSCPSSTRWATALAAAAIISSVKLETPAIEEPA